MIPFLRRCAVLLAVPLALAAADWPEYLGGPGRSSFSPLAQITPANVSRLRVAWEYRSGDAGQTQCNAIVVGGVLYGTTATNRVFALDAATGRELWRYVEPGHEFGGNQRGVAYWSAGDDRRVLFNINEWLYAIDARTGERIAGFGGAGRVSLKLGLGERARDKWVTCSSPGTVFENLIIMPTRVGELGDSAPGHVQAFNVRTGQLAWTFRTIPGPGEFGHETWPPDAHRNIDTGGANCWAGMAIDRARGIVFVPTGSAAPDFWGGARRGDNLFANCLLALDARTGRRLWHFQFVHHDIWDRDLPAPLSRGQRLYMFFCIACHGPEKKGNPSGGMPSLVDLAARVPRADTVKLMTTGRNMMPGFTSLSLADREAIAGWLYGDDSDGAIGAAASAPRDVAFEASAYAKFVDRHGYPAHRKFLDAAGNPAIKPPWGTLNAIDLNTGEFRWKVPLGGTDGSGAENYGGPLVTAGGLVFIAATKDATLRAFDRDSGRVVWESRLPAAAFATPSSYSIDGKQFIVIACGGGKIGAPRGDRYVAFALE